MLAAKADVRCHITKLQELVTTQSLPEHKKILGAVVDQFQDSVRHRFGSISNEDALTIGAMKDALRIVHKCSNGVRITPEIIAGTSSKRRRLMDASTGAASGDEPDSTQASEEVGGCIKDAIAAFLDFAYLAWPPHISRNQPVQPVLNALCDMLLLTRKDHPELTLAILKAMHAIIAAAVNMWAVYLRGDSVLSLLCSPEQPFDVRLMAAKALWANSTQYTAYEGTQGSALAGLCQLVLTTQDTPQMMEALATLAEHATARLFAANTEAHPAAPQLMSALVRLLQQQDMQQPAHSKATWTVLACVVQVLMEQGADSPELAAAVELLLMNYSSLQQAAGGSVALQVSQSIVMPHKMALCQLAKCAAAASDEQQVCVLHD